MNLTKYFRLAILLLLLSNCATNKLQIADPQSNNIPKTTSKVAHRFYLIGDGGNTPIGSTSPTLSALKNELTTAPKNSTLLFLGDNIYPSGLPKKKNVNYDFAKYQLDLQTSITKNFKGNTIFIPGNHDWYSNGLKGLSRQESYVNTRLGKNSFLPKNGCPIEKVTISEDIVLLVIDSEWFLTDWNKHPTINDNCELKTRKQFFDEYESLIKKARGKTTIVAMHHPLYTNGPHGGQYSIRQQLFPIDNSIPLPIIGSILNLIRKTSGISNTDLQNKKYIQFKKRIVTLSQENEKVIVVSGHEHSLQYLVQDNIAQIISGSGSKTSETRLRKNGHFSYGAPGYARLDILTDGSSRVSFYSTNDKRIVYKSEVLASNDSITNFTYKKNTDAFSSASIYSKKEVEKSKFYTYLWGERYRNYYGTKIHVKNVQLDTLLGGLTPVRKGGGHQSKSLRLIDKQGREYVLRALRKNAVQYLQAVAFKDRYIENDFDNTFSENLLLDVFTGSHPYAPFVVAPLAKAIGVFHTKPQLVYVPKQEALLHYNTEFGDELYMLEERAASGHGDKSNFGFANKVISTHDLLKKLRKDETTKIDESAYIRARLFDMILGDWDRHEDQWRWAAFKKDNLTYYKPIPRDRDQVFSIMADGALLNFITKSIPGLRLMQSYDDTLKNVKWFNTEPYPLDMALIKEAKMSDWNLQVAHIQKYLTSKIIKDAFKRFPKEVQDHTIQLIRTKLEGRIRNLSTIAKTYYSYLNKYAVITGTDKDDYFEIKRLENNSVEITGYRIKNGKKGWVFHNKKYHAKETKEIWVYGLDDEDVFHVFGNLKNNIKVRIIGGQNNDVYRIENNKNLTIYDYKSKKNTLNDFKGAKELSDKYETNVYDYKKLKYNSFGMLPTIGWNPDDGLNFGLSNTYTNYGFERNPFSSQISLTASYFLATKGFNLHFNSEFANAFGSWNMGFEALLTSPNYSVNFFGYGNNSLNPNFLDKKTFDEDYNRVRIKTLRFSPYLIWHGQEDEFFKVNISYASYEVEKTTGRYIENYYQNKPRDNAQSFVGIESHYHFENQDNKAFPTLGMKADFILGYSSYIEDSNSFAYFKPSLSFDYKITADGQLVLGTKLHGHVNFGNQFEFYQAASIGGNNGLRGYRNNRFSGKSAFYQNTDIRLNIRKIKTRLLPVHLGIFTGVDYGKVWMPKSITSSWNASMGAGMFLNGADMISANIGVFKGKETARLTFSLGFNF